MDLVTDRAGRPHGLLASLSEDKARGRFDHPVYEGGTPPLKATIKRDTLLEDAYRNLGGEC